jgi:hypothetical protein
VERTRIIDQGFICQILATDIMKKTSRLRRSVVTAFLWGKFKPSCWLAEGTLAFFEEIFRVWFTVVVEATEKIFQHQGIVWPYSLMLFLNSGFLQYRVNQFLLC